MNDYVTIACKKSGKTTYEVIFNKKIYTVYSFNSLGIPHVLGEYNDDKDAMSYFLALPGGVVNE